MSNIAIIGSKIFENTRLINKYIKSLDAKKWTIITGISVGVNHAVRLAAKRYRIPIIVHKPQFDKFGSQATIVANKRILEEAKIITIFYNGNSIVTANLIKEAKELKKDLELIVDK